MTTKRGLGIILIICFALSQLGATIFDTAPTILSGNAFSEKGNRVILGETSNALLAAYQSADGKIYLGHSPDGNRWESKIVVGIRQGALQALAVKNHLVVIGYADQGRIYTVTSVDGGVTFAQPTAIVTTNQNASFQGLAIDEQGIIHLLFHRHDGYWDYNYARSSNQGASYTTSLNFTGNTDSNSTGYFGNLIALHNNLYTVYQDTNDKQAIKLGVSQDGGKTWTIKRIASSQGGRLSFAVDWNDPNILYIGSVTADGVTVYKVTAATEEQVKSTIIRRDYFLDSTSDRVASIHLGLSREGLITVAVLNSVIGLYELVSSADNGATWSLEFLDTFVPVKNFEWMSDFKLLGDNFYFACHDGAGNILLHGKSWSPTEAVYRPDELGIIKIRNLREPFSIEVNQEYIWVFFELSTPGSYTITNLSHQETPLYLALTNYHRNRDLFLADNWPKEELEADFTLHLEADSHYMLALISLVSGAESKTITLEITPHL